jgi:hypothetical protein
LSRVASTDAATWRETRAGPGRTLCCGPSSWSSASLSAEFCW